MTAWGTYTFELRIKEVEKNSVLGIGEPLVDLRSTKLSISQHSYENRLSEDNDEMKAVVSYTLQSERVASKGEIAFLDATMEEKTSVPMQLQPDEPREDVELYTFGDNENVSSTQQDATYRAIFVAIDNFADDYRDHKPKSANVVNQGNTLKVFQIEDDKMVSPEHGALNAYARSFELRKAFRLNGWLAVTADTYSSNKRVNPAYCNIVPFHKQLHYEDLELFQFNHFDYKNKPRYIHSIAASEETEGSAIRGRGSEAGRFFYSFTLGSGLGEDGKSTFQYLGPPVKKVSIHEAGHVFGLVPDHLNNHPDAHPNVAGLEEQAFKNNNIKVLRQFRARPLNVSNPNRLQFTFCVMSQVGEYSDKGGFSPDYIFCPHHGKKIQQYKW